MDQDDSALYYAQRLYNISLQLEDSIYRVRAAYALGYLYKKIGSYPEASEYFEDAKEIAELNKSDSAHYDFLKSIYNGLGLAKYFQGIYEDALDAHLKSVSYREEEIKLTGNITDADLGLAYLNLGLVFYKLGDLDKAIEVEHQSIIEYKKVGKPLTASYVNLGLAFSQMTSYEYDVDYALDSALVYFYLAKKSCEDNFDDCADDTQFEINNGLALVFMNKQLTDSANFYLSKSGSLATMNIPNQVITLHNKASLETDLGNYESALKFLDRAQELSDSVLLRDVIPTNYELYADIYAKQNDYKKAYHFMVDSDSLKKEIFNEKVISRTKSKQFGYEERENEAVIAQSKSEIESKDTEIEQQNRLILYATIAIIIILGFAILLFRINILRKRSNIKLIEAKDIIEEKNQALEVLNNELEERVQARTAELNSANEALQQSNQELDNFIYKTSHDIRGPLATLQGICNVALMDVQDLKSIDYLQKLGKTAARLNEILSKLLVINQINNAMISTEIIDFEMIIDHVVQDNRKVNAASIAVIKEIDPKIDYQSDHDLVKIILSNLVNNSFKYYNESERVESFVKIRIDIASEHLKISVVDNGIGIDEKQGDKIFEIFSKASHLSDSAGLGLYLVKLAVQKLKGHVILKKTKERYTEFKVTLPLVPSLANEKY